MATEQIRIANAPCSWGTLEFDEAQTQKPAIPWGQMLDELRATGYEGTELGDWGYLPTVADHLAAELYRRELTLVAAFVPVMLKKMSALRAGLEQVLRIASLLAAVSQATGAAWRPLLLLADENGRDPLRTSCAGRISPAQGLTPREWRIFARNSEIVARVVYESTGLRTAFHHHCAGYVETPAEIAHFLELTDPSLIGLALDTGHYLYGSGSSEPELIEEALRRFGLRIWHLHFKDCSPAVAQEARTHGWDYFTALRHGLFCELGQGMVPFPAVVTWLRQHGYQGWIVVEQDVLPGMGSPYLSALRNRQYLRKLGL
ncbi:TIM barrel protein [Thermogemmatispora carboxidivorans]|uniref:TIM barrel protein n=1 Tax=Thermogemmatispora carboxidivorans TaxID=1382306 RepID=UPI00069B4E5A|nr:TIM barrel protein [Thermogemmatispora carboxidivorans]